MGVLFMEINKDLVEILHLQETNENHLIELFGNRENVWHCALIRFIVHLVDIIQPDITQSLEITKNKYHRNSKPTFSSVIS